MRKSYYYKGQHFLSEKCAGKISNSTVYKQ